MDLDWPLSLMLVLLTLLVVGMMWGLTSAVVIGLARGLHSRGRGRTPWSTFNRDAERLHRMTHPGEPNETPVERDRP